MATVIYADTHNTTSAQDLVSHTQEVQLALANISAQVDRIELSAELYQVTGSLAYLRSARETSETLQGQMRQLKSLVRSSGLQAGRQQHLEAAAAGLTHEVMLGRAGPASRNYVAECRRILGEMRSQEDILLVQRTAIAARENYLDVVQRVIVSLLGTIIILVLFGFLIRDAIRRGKYEEQLSEANAQLQRTVQRLEEQAFEARLLIDARDEVALCLNVEQAQECTVRYFAQLIPGTAGSLCLVDHSRHVMENAGIWGVVRGTAAFDGFAPECCCALRSGRPRWRRPEQSEVHCTHFSGYPPERYLCVPIVAHGDTLGVVTVECLSAEAAAMTEAREESVVSLAEMTAMAISGLQLREKLELQSIRDGMTGLFNRTFMEVALERELHRAARQQKELALMMVDVDHFKQFNDTFGHEAGDVVLREVAENLRMGVRGEDIACRYGGEEFVIIMPEISGPAAMERAELLRQRVEQLAPRFHGQPLRQVTISIGLALSPQHSDVSEQLLRAADRALYAAKHRGRNRVVLADSSVLA